MWISGEGDRNKQISRVTHCCNTFFILACWEKFRRFKWGKAVIHSSTVVLKRDCLHSLPDLHSLLPQVLNLRIFSFGWNTSASVEFLLSLGHAPVRAAIGESHHCRISGKTHSCFKTTSPLVNGLSEWRRNLCLLHAPFFLFSSGNWASTTMSCLNVPSPFHFTNDFWAYQAMPAKFERKISVAAYATVQTAMVHNFAYLFDTALH